MKKELSETAGRAEQEQEAKQVVRKQRNIIAGVRCAGL